MSDEKRELVKKLQEAERVLRDLGGDDMYDLADAVDDARREIEGTR